MDTQQVEIIGRNLLVSACIADGLEVASPLRDRVIDLLVYSDKNLFQCLPVQLKASSGSSFSVNKKYEKFSDILMAYTWHSDDPINAALYVMTYSNALEIARTLGWLTTQSWVKDGFYTSQRPNRQLIEMLSQYKYDKGLIGKWFVNNIDTGV